MKKTVFTRDVVVGAGFAASAAFTHLAWQPLDRYWQFLIVMLLVVTALSIWLVKVWTSLESRITRFFCLAIILDIVGEGLLQPYHHCTRDNILCTGRLFLVFIAFWLVLRPLEQRFRRKQTGTTATRVSDISAATPASTSDKSRARNSQDSP